MSNKIREEFEAWAKPLCMEMFEAWMPALAHNGEYRNQTTSMLWKAWQASRELLVVELPEPQPFKVSAEESLDMDPDEFEALEARHGAQWQTYSKCKKAIEAAGLKVKP